MKDRLFRLKDEKLLWQGSNNYLGLTAHPKVVEAAVKAVEKYGTGCSGSRYLTGTLDLHIELEARLAKFFKAESVLLFSTGYQTAQGVIPTLVGRNEYIISDKDNHHLHHGRQLNGKRCDGKFFTIQTQ